MADVPDSIVLRRDRDLDGRHKEVWARRGIMGVIAAVPIVALLNVFGQRPQTTVTKTPAASLKLYSPARLRSGVLYSARFHVFARRELKDARLLLSPGWAEAMQINTIEPSPINEASENGRLSFELGHIPAGKTYLFFMAFQVNPTNVGRRAANVELDDGNQRILTMHRTISIWP